MRTATLMLGIAGALLAQVAEKANENYRSPEVRAKIAASIASPDRDARQKPTELVAVLGLKPGMTVVDLGTAAGYMLPHLSKAVGPKGKVIAQDIYPDFLEAAKKTAASLENVEFVLGSVKGTNLPPGAADVIFVLDAYHHFDYPQEMLADLGRALKPDGRLVIVEYHKNEESMGRNGFALQHIRLAEDDAVKEIEAAGWQTVERKQFIPRVQWMGTFRKK